MSSPAPVSPPPSPSSSPSWGSTTKMVVGLTIVGIVAALLVQFRGIIGPLILAFILTYLIHPLAMRFSSSTKFTWRASVNLIYLLLVILLAGLITIAGLAVVQQLQSLIGIVQRFVTQLPQMVADLSSHIYYIGPFQLDFSQFDLQTLTDQLLAGVQPLLGQVGGLVGTLATSAAATIGWGIFVLLISYFLLADAEQVPSAVVQVEIPGYTSDLRRLGGQLRVIWNSFLRGQLFIISMVVVSYVILMTILGVRYSLAIAILAGLARFVPYAGPLTTWTVTGLVAFFQGSNHFGLEPLQFTILVIVCALILDQIFDNLVVPRFMGQTLGVHPAAVLVAALIATNLIGIIGLVLAAPVLATLKLLSRYIVRKMFDMDPWLDAEEAPRQMPLPWGESIHRLQAFLRSVQRRGE